MAFAGGVLRPGVEIVAEACEIESRIAGADLVITGEGRIDGQTPFGKTPAGVASVARKLGIPVVAVAGSLGAGYEAVYPCGISEVHPLMSGAISLDEALARAPELLAITAICPRAHGPAKRGRAANRNAALRGLERDPHRGVKDAVSSVRAISFRGGRCACEGAGCIFSTPDVLSCYARS